MTDYKLVPAELIDRFPVRPTHSVYWEGQK